MPRPRSANPGRHLSLYLRGHHLDVLRRFHPNVLKAVRACIEAAGAPCGAPDQAAPPQRFPTRHLCDACEIGPGYPYCAACRQLFGA
jgi:hypothetical protein